MPLPCKHTAVKSLRRRARALLPLMACAACVHLPPPEPPRLELAPQKADNIPALVQFPASLPRADRAAASESYSVVVHNVPLQELLFSLARDAKLNVDTYAYQERFKVLPGDDSGAAARWGSGVPNGDRGGAIAGEFCDDPSGTSEAVNFWRHLRLAGLLGGDITTAEQPANAAGGIFGAQTGSGSADAPELAGLVICASNLNGKIAAALDAQLDDGKPQSGSLRAYSQNRQALVRGCSTNATRATAVQNRNGYNAADDNELYTLCKSL